jgi:hypothetical protein
MTLALMEFAMKQLASTLSMVLRAGVRPGVIRGEREHLMPSEPDKADT